MQFFDVAVYAIGAGGICLGVYRALQQEAMGKIWDFPDAPESTTAELIIGTAVGAIAGGVGLVFRRCEVERACYATARMATRSPNGASISKATSNLELMVVRYSRSCV